MSNVKRGLIEIELGDGVHEIRFPTSALRVLQERFAAKTPAEVWQSMDRWSADDWVEVMYRGLQKGSDPTITQEQVDDIVLGTEIPYYQVVIMGALTASLEGRTLSARAQKMVDKHMQQVDAAVEEGADANPP